eukprot:467676_1
MIQKHHSEEEVNQSEEIRILVGHGRNNHIVTVQHFRHKLLYNVILSILFVIGVFCMLSPHSTVGIKKTRRNLLSAVENIPESWVNMTVKEKCKWVKEGNNKIGSGAFGSVYQRDNYVLKESHYNPSSTTQQQALTSELNMHRVAYNISPSNVPILYGHYIDKQDHKAFVLSQFGGTELAKAPASVDSAKQQSCAVLLQIGYVISELNKKGYAYKDLKAANVVYDIVNGTLVLKLIDFGSEQAVGTPSTMSYILLYASHKAETDDIKNAIKADPGLIDMPTLIKLASRMYLYHKYDNIPYFGANEYLKYYTTPTYYNANEKTAL